MYYLIEEGPNNHTHVVAKSYDHDEIVQKYLDIAFEPEGMCDYEIVKTVIKV